MNDEEDFVAQQVTMLNALIRAMKESESNAETFNHSSFKTFARKYNRIARKVLERLNLNLPVDFYDLDEMPGSMDTTTIQQKELFDSVKSDAMLMRNLLEQRYEIDRRDLKRW